ncbi:MAG: MFS transporter [Gammaproteobacteria bacterium]|nr:MFS transporter [Gammaproteobacteria bacterium]
MFNLQAGEFVPVFWSFAYFYCLLSSYYVIRPVRDEMGIVGGVDQLQWLFTATFLVMLAIVPLFGAVSNRYPRHRLLPAVYLFFIANLLIFNLAFTTQTAADWIARIFFVWVSVFNLFVVSVFWSFMADLFSNAQGKRLFGLIATGGSLGAISGPTLTASLSTQIGTSNLLLVSAVLLSAALLCIRQLLGYGHSHAAPGSEEALGGNVLSGIQKTFGSRYLLGIALFIWLYTTLSTFLYFEQAHIVKAAFADSDERTRVFALIDLAVNGLTILFQVFVTGHIMRRLGVATTLASIPALLALGFMALALLPILPVLILTQVVRRAGNYAFTKPAREVLFTVVDRESKYKAKNFIDTVIYRGGDAVSGWLFTALKGLGLGLSGIAWIAVPVALIWMILGLELGKMQRKLALQEANDAKTV